MSMAQDKNIYPLPYLDKNLAHCRKVRQQKRTLYYLTTLAVDDGCSLPWIVGGIDHPDDGMSNEADQSGHV